MTIQANENVEVYIAFSSQTFEIVCRDVEKWEIKAWRVDAREPWGGPGGLERGRHKHDHIANRVHAGDTCERIDIHLSGLLILSKHA